MHFANREVVEIETQFRRDVFVRGLFVWQHDVQPDGSPPRINCTTVARLHHTGSTTRDDHVLTGPAHLRHQLRKLARFIVIL